MSAWRAPTLLLPKLSLPPSSKVPLPGVPAENPSAPLEPPNTPKQSSTPEPEVERTGEIRKNRVAREKKPSWSSQGSLPRREMGRDDAARGAGVRAPSGIRARAREMGATTLAGGRGRAGEEALRQANVRALGPSWLTRAGRSRAERRAARAAPGARREPRTREEESSLPSLRGAAMEIGSREGSELAWPGKSELRGKLGVGHHRSWASWAPWELGAGKTTARRGTPRARELRGRGRGAEEHELGEREPASGGEEQATELPNAWEGHSGAGS